MLDWCNKYTIINRYYNGNAASKIYSFMHKLGLKCNGLGKLLGYLMIINQEVFTKTVKRQTIPVSEMSTCSPHKIIHSISTLYVFIRWYVTIASLQYSHIAQLFLFLFSFLFHCQYIIILLKVTCAVYHSYKHKGL